MLNDIFRYLNELGEWSSFLTMLMPEWRKRKFWTLDVFILSPRIVALSGNILATKDQ